MPTGVARPPGPVIAMITVVLLVIAAALTCYLLVALLAPERF